MSLPLATSATTHPGLQHPKNEDSHAVFETEEGGIVLLVCDGMGGMGRGDEASKLAVESLQADLVAGRGFPPDRLRVALRRADDAIRQALCATGEGNPGSTAVAVYVVDGAAHVAWVGDSRAYHLRRGAVIERTRDHKLVEELVASGQLTEAQAKASALAHVVTRALGGRPARDATVKPASPGHVWKLLWGDRIVVMSDGVCDLLDDNEIASVGCEGTIEAARDRMVEIALERGGHDNITCILAQWDGPDWVEEEVATPVMRPGRELDLLLQDESTLHPDSLPTDERLPLLEPHVLHGDADRVTEEIAHSDPGPATEPLPLPIAPPGKITPAPAHTATPGQAALSGKAAVSGQAVPTDPATPTTRPAYAPPAPPPDPGPGVRFDWRFLAAIALLVAALLTLLAWLTS